MRIAALYDIHGNLPALEAVLDEVHREAIDQIVVGGDIFPGPMSCEALACLLGCGIPAHFIRGNGEREMLALVAGEEASRITEPHRSAMRWAAQQLEPQYQRVIAAWPDTLCLDLDGLGEVLFCHATPGSDAAIFTKRTSEERLLPVFENIQAAIVVCGHTHMQFDRMVGGVRVVNAGSVGMPFGKPGAYWLLLEPDGVQLRRTGYDLNEAVERIRGTDYPQAGDFAQKSVLNPPSEQQMLQLYLRAELT